ncbi:MAG: hypothetical protein WAP34_11695, partial [Desulfomonilia bacterium]
SSKGQRQVDQQDRRAGTSFTSFVFLRYFHRVKLPRWIREYTGKDLHFDVNAGPLLDRWLSEYRLIVHCGGCMINRKEMLHRIAEARNSGTPITNYGIAISHVHGVLDRVLSPFPLEREILKTGLGDR